jgi:hypothetical protein
MTNLRAFVEHGVTLPASTRLRVKQADRQWFHLPRTAPPIAAGNLLPIASDLVDGYTPAVAASSRRRVAVNAEIQPKIGRDNLADEHFPIVRVHGRPPEEL